MREESGPYVRHSLDESQQCVYVEIREVPEGWERILHPKRRRSTLIAIVAALAAWVLAAVSTITTLAG